MMRVLIAGAGPAGASAAIELARAGASVTIAERSAWPREKTCGDGISPLAIAECRALGVEPAGEVRLRRARISTPRGRAFRGAWPHATPYGTTIARRDFDALLVDRAIACGAAFEPQTHVRDVERDGSRMRASLVTGESRRTVDADVVIVAEGANGSLAGQLGFEPFRSRLIAVRGYAATPAPLAPEYGLFYDALVSPGYGWVFPMDATRANVGICVDERALARAGGNARAMLDRWLQTSRFARELLGERVCSEAVKGGIIPTGRTRVRGAVFAIGDAAGVADPFTAEGISQAIRTGRLAARALAAERDVRAAGQRYERDCAIFDRNARTAYWLRRTFALAIEPFAIRAADHARLGDYLNTAVFFEKSGFVRFVAGALRAAV